MDLKTLEARREERRKKLRDATEAQRLRDLMALDALEEQHGPGNLRMQEIATPPELPGIVVIRRPDPAEYRNWLAAVRKTTSDKGEATRALGSDVRLYPDAEEWAKVVEVLPGVEDVVGAMALQLSGGTLSQKND